MFYMFAVRGCISADLPSKFRRVQVDLLYMLISVYGPTSKRFSVSSKTKNMSHLFTVSGKVSMPNNCVGVRIGFEIGGSIVFILTHPSWSISFLKPFSGIPSIRQLYATPQDKHTFASTIYFHSRWLLWKNNEKQGESKRKNGKTWKTTESKEKH